MGRYSYWIKDLESVRTVDDAAKMLDAEDFGISIDHLENVWAVCDRGRPQFWRDTQAEADEIADRSGPIKWSVEHYANVWRVCMGDQYIFTTGINPRPRASSSEWPLTCSSAMRRTDPTHLDCPSSPGRWEVPRFCRTPTMAANAMVTLGYSAAGRS